MVTNQTNNRRASSKSGEKIVRKSYTPISDALKNPQVFADTELGDGIKRHGLVNTFSKVIGKARRSDAVDLPGLLMALIIWPLLGMSSPSIHSFCTELGHFIKGGGGEGKRRMDILYSFLRRGDINWRTLATSLANKVWKSIDIGPPEGCAFVIDDTLKKRRGKKVEGSSRHWDHTENRS